MYESPIETIYENVQAQFEDAVLKAVQKAEIDIDKDELIKALKYDRKQYDNGYFDGWGARDESIVRCKDCKWWKLSEYNTSGIHVCQKFCGVREEYDFCSRGENK